MYSVNRGRRSDFSVAINRYDLWRILEGSGWPYAYALYFYCVNGKEMIFFDKFSDYINHGAIDKLVAVYNALLLPKDAYDKLIML